ncbi:armadillo-type protein [Geopyxis carbonaria]|nr:armadillo-type protein [Geopyxis carbonaria]
MADDDIHTEAVQLDVTKLTAITEEPQQQLFVLSFLSSLERLVDRLDADGASAYQLYVQKELLRIVQFTTPAPTRLIRNVAGRCFHAIFEKGDRKLLYDTINELLALINAGKDKDIRIKHAAVHCLGEVFAAAGDSAVSVATFAASSLLKLLKNSQNHCGLRGSTFRALGKVFRMVAAMSDENIARDVWKQARNTVGSEKSAVVQGGALQCLEEMMKNTPYFTTQSDYEKLQSGILKALDTTSASVRKAAASCLASVLVLAYSNEPAELINKNLKRRRTAKRNSMAPTDDDVGMERPGSPAPSKKQVVRMALTLEDILKQISTQYVKPTISHRVRAGLAQTYIDVMVRLGPTVVESQYGLISNHLLVDILSHPGIIINRFRVLTTRKYVRIILEEVICGKLLGETGQLNAVRKLVNDVIKNYPQVIKEKSEPSKHTLTGALHALAHLIKTLGSATALVQDIVRDGLIQVLQHPSYTVQITTSWCLRAFVMAVPLQLLPILTICMNNVNRELAQLTTRRPTSTEAFRRCTGYANGLAAAISSAPVQPLYASVDVTSRILSLATSLLKSSGDYDLRISSTQIQVAWILIGGLMALGPNFVKIHLSQLLLLWKNALPKPLAKDSTTERSLLELSFLSHVRECALGSILSFLEFNHRLLTTDVSKRIAAMLQNSTLFLNTLPSKKTTDDVSQLLSPSLQLLDFDLMVRRRVLQCYVKLVKLSHAEALQANLLTIAVTFFADPEKYTPSSLSTAIANSVGNFESLWEIGDNYAYGVAGFVKGYDIDAYAFEGRGSKKTIQHWMTRDSPEAKIEDTLHTPVLGSIEHDSVSLYLTEVEGDDASLAPPATAVVNSAIDLFTVLLPMQPPKVQESILEQIATFLASKSLERDPGRKAAMTVNVAVALLGTIKLTIGHEIPSANLNTPSVLKIISELLQGFVVLPDSYVRNVAYEALGRLCSIGGNAFTGNMVNWLVDTIVNNRDPNARAGSAVALGCIHSHVGGMAAGFHLKTIIGILMSLSNDPHPIVHFWALEGLSRTIDSAGLTFASYVTSTLGMLSQLYVAETHNAEVGSLATSNLELELPTQSILVRCIDSLIGVLGPDLQDITKARELILTMIGQFLKESDYGTQMEALRCLEHLSMFAAGHVDMGLYVKRLQKELSSEQGKLRDIAINGLFQLMKGDAERILISADPGLEEQLWTTLDENPTHEGIQNILRNWMSQTGLEDPAKWVDRCQTVMTKLVERKAGIVQTQEVKPPSSGPVDLGDEEVAGMAGGEKESQRTAQEPLRWQVRTFAIDVLGELLSLAAHEITNNSGSPLEDKFVERIGDIVKMAFSASTSNVVNLRLGGLRIINQVLKMFGHTPDPDFADAPLLEQYQAQIGSAMTPAFAADSSPELATAAINVCAGFIATGIVKDVDRMGRILKLLTNALENFSTDTENASIGDLKGLSSNAQVMVKMAVLRAWAELQVASKQQKYLADVVKPYITTLAPMWLSSLREFARLRFEPDVSPNNSGTASLGGSIDTIYAALNRETLLRFYQDSWLKLVDAIASLIEEDSQFVFDALDGKDSSSAGNNANGSGPRDDINYRDEPVAFFFVLFGIAFEALVGGRPGAGDSLATKEQTLEILLALKKILHPSVCGHAIYQEVIFSETMDLLDRLVLTEGMAVKLAIVDIARALCVEHPAARGKTGKEGDRLTEDIDQLFELTRLIVLVLAGMLPNLVDSKTMVRQQLSEEAVDLIRTSLDALVDAAEVFPAVIRMDLYASILHIFTTIFGTGVCQSEVIPRSLPIFKRFIQIITKNGNKNDAELVVMMVRSSLSSIMRVLDHAKLRGEVAIPCIRNTLMAATIVVTAGVNILPPNDSQLPALVSHVLSSLTDPSTATIAAQCTRTLVSTNPKTATDQELIRILLPKLITFVTSPYEPSEEPAKSAIAQILTHFATSILYGAQLKIAITLFVPMLLEHARLNQERRDVVKETGGRLLELAGADRDGFKAVVAGLGPEQRTFLESIIKSAVASDQGEVKRERGQGPSIELKMNFGA